MRVFKNVTFAHILQKNLFFAIICIPRLNPAKFSEMKPPILHSCGLTKKLLIRANDDQIVLTMGPQIRVFQSCTVKKYFLQKIL
jgi:hypothetical protein